MTLVEVILIIVGIAFLVVSFFVEEKLSQKDIEKIADLSEKELKILVEKQLHGTSEKVEAALEDAIDHALDNTKRGLEKSTNEKIMAISEYSDTVLESMNKTHNEILFLYSMLGDKHKELTELANQLQQFSATMKQTENEVLEKLADSAKELESTVLDSKEVDEEKALEASVNENDDLNHNEKILELHKQGYLDVSIAKELGLGLGEVKFVIGLYKEDAAGEV